METTNFLEKFKARTHLVANPHYYTGRSISLLALKQAIRFLFFLKTERPTKSSLIPISKLKDSGRGRSALVLGNGPSLNSLIPQEVKKYFDDIFVVNGFHNLKISDFLKPTYYCLSDPLDESEVDDPKSHEGENLRNYFNFHGNCVRILPHTWRSKTGVSSSQTVYFDDRERTIFSRNISPLKPRAYTSVTLYKALAVACHMGYDKIFILGFDNTEFNNYRGSADNECHLDETTYAEMKPDRKYSSGNFTLPFISGMAGRMQSYALLFGDLLLFAKYPIFNLDPNSLTDAFPKIASHPTIKLPR